MKLFIPQISSESGGEICKIVKQTRQSWFVFLVSIIAFLSLSVATGLCESTNVDVVPDETVNGNVELTPGYIGGTVDLGGQNINRIDLTARSTDYSAQIYPTAEGAYSMTVNVPKGSTLDYTVSGRAWMDNWTTWLYFKSRSTVVEEGKTSQVDFIINPGYIAVEIVSNGCTLVKSDVRGVLNIGEAYSLGYTRRGSESSFRFPIQPNDAIRVYGQVQLSSGETINLESKYIDVVSGADTPVTWELTCGPGQLGAIQHDVDYHMTTDYHYSYLYNKGAWSPSFTARHAGSHLFDDIAPGDWRLYTYSYWNNGHNLIAKDIRDISVAGGETVNVAIDEFPGFLQGRVTLKGTKTIQDTYNAYLYGYGKNSLYPSFRSTSRALIEKSEGAFNLALPHGEWDVFLSTFFFYNPSSADGYLYSYLYMYDYDMRKNTLFMNSNDIVTGHDITYETGSATIKFSRSDGGAFTSPYLYARCYNRDETGVLNSYIYSWAYGVFNGDRVTFVGFPGTYEVDAWAMVDGSRTMFGKATVEIVAGVDKVVDIGGPSLTVTTPAPETVVTENKVVVSGTATDEMGVDWITVNGVDVPFTFTDNPDDPNEVSFSVEIELVEGTNVIETVAADTSGNESSDTRNVLYEVPLVTIISGTIDIKPGSCKNPLNVKSNGVLPVVILGSADFDVAEIDPSSITLAGVAILRSAIEDVSVPSDSGCHIEGSDGYDDLVLKFDTQEIVAALGAVSDSDIITLILNGILHDGTEFSGEDHVTVLVKGNTVVVKDKPVPAKAKTVVAKDKPAPVKGKKKK